MQASAVALTHCSSVEALLEEVAGKIHVCSETEVWQTFICHKTELQKG